MTPAEQEMADLMAYDDICARLWHDQRLPSGTRELALALAWANTRDPERGSADGNGSLARAGRLLGRDTNEHWRHWRHWRLLSDDAPRYIATGRSPHSGQLLGWGPGSCEGPRLRPYRPRVIKTDAPFFDGRGGVSYEHGKNPDDPSKRHACGAHGSICVTEHDQRTGQVSVEHWFCTRHRDQADRVREQLAAAEGNLPEPVPNHGGLLPCYFAGPWEHIYRKATRNLWKPPFYGVCADEWPSIDQQVMVPRRPRLSVVV